MIQPRIIFEIIFIALLLLRCHSSKQGLPGSHPGPYNKEPNNITESGRRQPLLVFLARVLTTYLRGYDMHELLFLRLAGLAVISAREFFRSPSVVRVLVEKNVPDMLIWAQAFAVRQRCTT